MKTFLILLLTVITSCAGERYVIGLTPFLEKSAKDDVFRRIVGMVLEDLPQKSSLAIFDAYRLTNIMRLEIPDVRAFASSKTRANQYREQVAQLRQFLAAEHERPNVPRLKFDQAVRLPQFMDFLGENLGAADPATIIVIGSPLYADAKEPAFSMAEGYFPSDGHLLATRDQSPFGLKNREETLKNYTVHFGYLGDPWVSAIHQEKIARFWTLYLERQGARLATFVGDPATLFAAVKNKSTTRETRYELAEKDTKLEMLRVTRDVAASDWITRDVLSGPRPAAPTKTVGPMKIGIRWKGEIDLDLYASASADSETLFFEHTRAAEGYYFKDHRNSPDREYEFIEFEAPVDLNRVRANINYYKGSEPAPRGEIRIEFDGRIYSSGFQIAADRGNKGREGTSQTAYWARIDVPAVLGLRADRN